MENKQDNIFYQFILIHRTESALLHISKIYLSVQRNCPYRRRQLLKMESFDCEPDQMMYRIIM